MTTKPNGITPEELAAIRERAERATPGRWSIAGRPPCVVSNPTGPREVICVGQDSNVEGQRDNWDDMQFIAHAREDIPKLLAEIERLQSVIRGVRSIANEFDYMSILGYLDYLDGGDAE
ncbi:ead/Ea22-like family protein [Brevibacillus agri]|uniref:ead/Ea22-like family protein n=1 Tax=Brevibacillus agri TaxID=51101 RepID=UPI001EE6085B|nr:ead/Ea22-like family protein [Brevibacillus agri]MCG5252570.1 ead/Ea22-like family protein [Brevibacillus agri]